MPDDTLTFASSDTGRRVLLSRRDTLVLHDAQGAVIKVDKGCLWITMENDPRDILLVPGMCFEVDRSGRTVIAAEEDSRLRVYEPAHEGSAIARITQKLAHAAGGTWWLRDTRRAVPSFY